MKLQPSLSHCTLLFTVGLLAGLAATPWLSGRSLVAAEQKPDSKPAPAANPAAPANPAPPPAAKPAEAPKDAKKDPAEADKAKKDAKPADAKTEAKKESSDDAAKPHRVKKGLLRIEVVVDGSLEPQEMSEIILRPQEWSGLSVLKAIDHGSAVKRGDLVLALDPEKIDHAIADLRSEIQLDDIALKQAELQLEAMDKSSPLDFESAQRAQRNMEEDAKQFFEVERPLFLKATEFSLQSAKDYVEYEEEELHQLEKMYRADDMREETEKIVLKRAQDAVKRAPSTWNGPRPPTPRP